ncbi:MAG: SDR family oxidoreductase [Gammaproteobacteria bacterium]|nr:SDR family oxidoreductase [Gammaproteobacteria bacterium]
MILVTGATGFVGQNLVGSLLMKNKPVRACVRSRYNKYIESPLLELFIVKDLEQIASWEKSLQDIEVVIHTAARVHIMEDKEANPLAEFRKVNTEGTLNLARQAAEHGIRRFIFISSIKVNGEMTTIGEPFKPTDNTIPTDPYGLSKYEAEQGLLSIADETGMEVVIIRPPLIYGPGVKANFASMMKWVSKGIPSPLGAIENQRSLIALENLTDFIIHSIDHPKAANEVFLISDDEDVSTTELLRKVAKAFGKQTTLLPIPVNLMTFFARLFGKKTIADRLFSSLQIDSSKVRDLLDWKPVITMDEQLRKTAEAYIKNEKNL